MSSSVGNTLNLKDDIICNEKIRSQRVRLVGNETTVIPTYEALKRARAAGMDLVQVAPGDIPVCRILDLDRHRYEKSKAERENAKRQREMRVDTKEIQLRPVTGDSDIAVKARRSKEFLDNGDKVKVTVKFRGRERAYREEAYRIVEKFLSMIGEHKIETPIRDNENKDAFLILAPIVSKAEVMRAKK